MVSRQLARIAELVNSLLDATALHEGRLEVEVEVEPFDMVRLVDCARTWREMYPDVVHRARARAAAWRHDRG